MDRKIKWVLTGVITLLMNAVAFSQQLKLGKNPYIIEKSAVLELQSDNQGLLFPRIADTTRITAMNPPDGMVVFHIPSLQLLLRTGGYWKPLTVSSSLSNLWSTTGNAATTYPVNFLGTTDLHSLYFRTANIQRLVIDSLGNVAIGTAPVFSVAPSREKFLVDAGLTTSINAIVGRGTIDSHLQLNVQNFSTGTLASSNIVATANNSSGVANYVKMGINGQSYSNGVMGGANDSYLYNIGQNFLIGSGSASKSLIFMTGGTSVGSNERMRIDGNGKIGIGITIPTAFLHLTAGTLASNTAPLKFSSGPLMAIPEAGAVEYLTDKFYGTITTLSARKEFTLNDIGLTSGRVPFSTTDGRLTDLGTFTYTANRLSPTYLTLASGTATAGTAPLVMSAGTKLNVPVAGSIEFDGTHFYGTVGSTRYPFDQQAGTTYTGSNGIALVGNDFRNTLFTGIAGDQTVRGGTAASNSLILSSTIHATKGKIVLGTSAYNEANNRLGIGNTIPTEVLDVTGNLKFSGALMPNNNAGTAGYFLTSTGASSAPAWNAFDTTSITGFSQKVRSLFTSTAPITYLNGLIGINKATGSANGYLSSDDWNTFNNKSGSFTSGNLTETVSSVLTIAGGGNAVLGTGTTLQVKQASASQNGFLSSNDWIAFNTKLSTIDTNAISNFYLKVRGEFSAGSGISYNNQTGVIGNTGVLSLNGNAGALTMDTNYISNFYLKSRSLVSAGTGVTYNASTGVISSSINTGNFWSLGGNTVTTLKTFGTIDNIDLPFMTNNAEGMRLNSAGNLGIGTTNPSNKLSILGTNPLFMSGVQTGSVADSLLTISGGVVKKLSLSALSSLAVSSVGLALPSIFNVSGSPVTSTGVLTGTLVTQPANRFFAGPAAGANTQPTFRVMVPADLPIATASSPGAVSVGGGLSITAEGILSATNTNGGTVTSVSASGTQGVTATVATGTTTPAITIGLGTITPISVAATGSVTGSNLSGINTGDQTITLTSDITGTGTGSFATTISANVVSYSKMQQVTAATLLGNPTGLTANASEITLGSGFSFSGSTLNYTPGTSGTVSSVGLTLPDIFSVTVSPITTTGSLTAVLATQAANKIFAGPVTGVNAAPAFRSMVAADLPFATTSAVGGVSVGGGLSVTPTGVLSTSFNLTSLSATAPLTYINTTGVMSLAKATGSVNGYLASTDWTIFNNKVGSVSITGSPVFATTALTVASGAASGTLTLNTQAKNLFFSGPATGLNAAPTFRALAPADLPLATTTTVGGVSVGAGLSVTAGVLSATNTNGGTVTTVSATGTQGVSASVVNATTTPAITIGLGDITPISVAATGSVTGSNLSGINTGDQTISLTSDITGTGTGSFATTISPNVVSYSKMQQITGSRLLGNPTGLTANALEITLGSGFSFSGSTLNYNSPVSGTVTSVGLSLPLSVFSASSPVTTSGSLTSAFVAQTANRFFAGPATGVNAVPGFRALVAADLPLATTSTIGGVSVGAGLSVTAGVLSATNTAMGTVTSVGLSLPVSIFSASAPITTSGSLTSALVTQPVNSVFAGPASGLSAAVPSFRNLVPSDLPFATATTVGVISVGSGLNIDVAGVLTTSVNSSNVWSQAGNTVTSLKKLGTIDNFDLPFVTNNTERMRLTSAGYLGIGTSYPATALHVVGTNPLTLTGVQVGATTDSILTIMSGTVKKLAFSSVTNGSSWSPSGNSGTNSVTNFLGTIDTRSLSFRTNNIQRMFIDSLTGNVGIGTSTPASDLTVFQKAGTIGSRGIRFAGTPISGTNAGTGFSMVLGYNQPNNKQLWLGDADYLGNSGGTFFRFSASGGYTIIDAINGDNSIRKAIGIGVANDVNSGVILGSDNNAASPTSYVWANGNMAIGAGYRASGAPLNGLIVQGNVGIGTSTPSATLDIVGSLEMNGPFRPSGDGGVAGYFLQSTGATTAPVWFNADNLIQTQAWGLGGNGNTNLASFLGTTNSIPLMIRTKNTERMRIDTLGRVGIGTTTPSQKLDVDGNLNVQGSVYVDGDATNTGTVTPGLVLGGASSGESISSKRTSTPNQYGIDFYTASNLRMTIFNGGSVGIGTGTATPLDKLTVAGSIGPNSNAAYNLGNTTYRWSQVYATNGVINTSDRREKTNIFDLHYGLKEILALRPVSYNWKKTPGGDKMLGLIAQEVKEVIPEVVVGDESKEMLGVKYADMIPVLINAIKEQQKQIDDLKQQIKMLQK